MGISKGTQETLTSKSTTHLAPQDKEAERSVFTVQMFAPNVGQASRAGRTEKKKKLHYTTRSLHNSIK